MLNQIQLFLKEEREIIPYIISAEELKAKFDLSKSTGNAHAPSTDRLLDMLTMDHSLEYILKESAREDINSAEDNSAPTIRIIDNLLNEAIQQRASDIHLEYYETGINIRFRIDGVMKFIVRCDSRLAPPLISRIKIMAKLDIAERRLPQDGRFMTQVAGHPVDVRVSIIPNVNGERVVLRLLDKSRTLLTLDALGLFPHQQKVIQTLLQAPHGIILVTGPTGSGKSTTLHTCLTSLTLTRGSLLTIEDPVEYEIPGVGQTQVNEKIGMTFASGLRAILRQDPDVVMIGEIRDPETAVVAIQASLTGHLVLSTLHTNTALGAINRLCDMGSESYLLASSLVGIIAQRLVRRLCPHCKHAFPITPEQKAFFSGLECPEQLWQPEGCEICHGEGFFGRVGLYHIVSVNKTIKQAIQRAAGEEELEKCMHGTDSLFQDGLNKVAAGLVTLEDVLQVTGGRNGDI
ncbi:GspE/PulE family protein [Serratia quinivorans]|uniref:GspE/PulE family protein n=1 Tax=Serratia quinivorans TaxID=137545 RepID=UPI0021BA8CA8|nr:GspE/PulE family protein [Serratia quinivorans]